MHTKFYGTDTDLDQIWRWLFEMPGVRVCEIYSCPDKDNRWFATLGDIKASCEDFHNNLAAWSPAFGGLPRAEKITFAANYQKITNATGRTALRSPAFITLGRSGDQNGCMASASMSCWNEAGARERSICSPNAVDQVDWKALRAASGIINRRIKKASPAKAGTYLVMPDAFEKWKSGEVALWLWGVRCDYPSDQITVVSPG